MSLVQRVTSIEGTDRESQPPLENIFNDYGETRYGHGYGTLHPALQHKSPYQESLRRVISYDVLHDPSGPSQATNPKGGVTAYKVSLYRRFGESIESPNRRMEWRAHREILN